MLYAPKRISKNPTKYLTYGFKFPFPILQGVETKLGKVRRAATR